jgi:hypothetical protein
MSNCIDNLMKIKEEAHAGTDSIHFNACRHSLLIIGLLLLLVSSCMHTCIHRIIRSPHATGDIFRAIMHGHADVDVHKAVSCGADNNNNTNTGGTSNNSVGNTTNSVTDNGTEQGHDDARAAAREMLLSLPGVNVHNFRAVMDKVENIAELSKLTESQLSELLGPGNAKKLYHFFRRRTLVPL